jgi:hypothetical protein
MKYIYLRGNITHEIINDINPTFPDVPIEQRYSVDFLSKCITVEDSVDVPIGYIYENGVFNPPVAEEPVEQPPVE